MKTFLLAFGALFSIVNPLSGAFIFFGATRELETRVRSAVSRWVAIYAFSIVTASLDVGAYVLSFFGITIPVLRVAGGIVVSLSGWAMLTAPDATEQRRSETPAPRSIDIAPSRLAFYPLTMPLTTGPGTGSSEATGTASPGAPPLIRLQTHSSKSPPSPAPRSNHRPAGCAHGSIAGSA